MNHFPHPRTAAALALAALSVLGLAACEGGTGAKTDPASTTADAAVPQAGGPTGRGKPPKLLWMGDSVAEAEAPALGAALRASGGEFTSVAATASGNVTGSDAAETWKWLPEKLAAEKPQVLGYQITAFDWGTPDEQRKGYERLVKAVQDVRGKLVIVSTPPIRHNEIQKPHAAELAKAKDVAQEVARRHADTVTFVDSSELWGTDPAAEKAMRSKDGIHNCQQAAATFAQWFGGRLGKQYGFTLAPAEKWATGKWTGDASYGMAGCS
ncbi:SGNH/GDSL hydrolase family protein [Streptomyces sp. NPDC088745]|uniref:SGNH/GDSL hydrolase family protein n=1 Tax=Streptomyces sp. NPDC088745 TaxID=3365884 RepID=UPI0037FF9EDA